MRKYIYLLFLIVSFAQIAAAQSDCDKHIDDYFNKNYYYAGGVEAKMQLARQRECIHSKDREIYSDFHEFERKMDRLLSIDDSFLVRKNLIDYQEISEVLAKNGNIKKSSEYVDKFNDILVKRYDKILSAKILLEQVQSGHISKNHQEELFKELDEYLPKLEKCNPDICEGWGLISLVLGAFPKCGENSCQKNITYENLYFALAKTTNNLPNAAVTIEKLLAKDFGSSKSNGEVKAPLIMALYYADYEKFLEESKNFLNKAQKTIKYNYQDAILLPIITRLMIVNGEAGNLLPYTKTKHKNIAGLEATLALLSLHLGDNVRQELRANLEYYYELTSACEDYRYEVYNGERILRAGTPATLTQNTELDLFLRQRIQVAYWIDDSGNLLNNKATNYWCSPAFTPEEIDPIFSGAQIAKQFIKEGFIDDIVLLPLFAFNKIKAVLEGMHKAPQTLRVSFYNDKALEIAKNTHRLEIEMEQNLRRLNEITDYPIAIGQDFIPDYIGDRGINIIRNGKTSSSKHYGTNGYYEFQRKFKETTSTKLEGPREFHNNNYPENFDNLPKKAQRRIEKEIEYFEQNSEDWMKNIGYENTKKIAKIMGVKWEELKGIIQNPQITIILQTCNPTTARSVIDRIERLYNKYYYRIMNNTKSKFTIAYFTNDGIYDWFFDANNIFLIEEINTKHVNLDNIFKFSKLGKEKARYLSPKNLFSPKNPKQTLEAYIDLLKCTEIAPCSVEFTEGDKYLRMLSYDGKRLIRVTPHEYYLSEETYVYLSNREYKKIKEFPRYHFHYYEIYSDRALNYHINIDLSDKGNNMFAKSPQEVKDLLIPTKEILMSPLIKTHFN